MGTIFALSWLITWFGHVLSDFRHVVRLYDFFLACHPLMPIYFAAVVRICCSLGEASLGEASLLLLSRRCRLIAAPKIKSELWGVDSPIDPSSVPY